MSEMMQQYKQKSFNKSRSTKKKYLRPQPFLSVNSCHVLSFNGGLKI